MLYISRLWRVVLDRAAFIILALMSASAVVLDIATWGEPAAVGSVSKFKVVESVVFLGALMIAAWRKSKFRYRTPLVLLMGADVVWDIWRTQHGSVIIHDLLILTIDVLWTAGALLLWFGQPAPTEDLRES